MRGARWSVVALGAVAVVVVGFVVARPAPDPMAYEGSAGGYGVADLAGLTGVPLPDCARPTTRFYVHPPVPENVTFDFAAPADCVDAFLTGFGMDPVRPMKDWGGVGEPPLLPAGDSAALLDIQEGDRIELWHTVKGEEEIDVAVNRSVTPQRVHLVAFPRL